MTERILVIEDEPQIAAFIQRGLIYDGYSVDVSRDGAEGLATARDFPPELVILDIMLPGIDGFEVCKRLRAAGNIPILMLTARDDVSDKVRGLDAGADDYLTKPFNFNELSARVRALLRRRRPEEKQTLRYADLTLNETTREVWRGTRKVELTSKEFELLELFMLHPRQVLTRDVIYERIWNYDFGGESNIIEVYIRYLRSKLEAGGEPRLLQTVRGAGYALREE
ncbi:MAG: response regulator transcription factor [Chloroflexi bacterium]|nr:response regulator transcription factor [Chloroflexota bacterium]